MTRLFDLFENVCMLSLVPLEMDPTTSLCCVRLMSALDYLGKKEDRL